MTTKFFETRAAKKPLGYLPGRKVFVAQYRPACGGANRWKTVPGAPHWHNAPDALGEAHGYVRSIGGTLAVTA